jgi:muramidase (phage lysozyme)
MNLNKYQWAAITAGLLAPAVFFLIKKEMQKVYILTTAQKNMRAFLLMIQYSEGTAGVNAYRMLYGGGLFKDFSKHPNTPVKKWGITSTAAGAYQFLYKTWKEIQTKLKLPDFSPISQDRAAIELIKRRKALDDVLAGRFEQAITKCQKEWASLPGAGYGQKEHSTDSLLSVYKMAGGNVIAA